MKSKLLELCSGYTKNISLKDVENKSGSFPIYGASGFIKNIDFYVSEVPYIAVVKDGAGVGRAFLCPKRSSLLGTMQYIVPRENLDIRYLLYAIQGLDLGSTFRGSTIPHIYFKDYNQESIKVVPYDEQVKIADKFELITKIVEKCKNIILLLDELVKSRFIEMFGDPVLNPFEWPVKTLLEMGYCKNGINFNTNDNGVKMHCLGVGDFKDNDVIDETETLQTVSLRKTPSAECLLQNGDIVFVRSNGNKALVGRCVLVFPNNVPTTYSGFCIRYRLTDSTISPIFLLCVLKTKSMREKVRGRGANIQNLNQQILSTLCVPIPPIGLQKQFVAFKEQVDKSKLVIKRNIAELENLRNSLMQKYFFD